MYFVIQYIPIDYSRWVTYYKYLGFHIALASISLPVVETVMSVINITNTYQEGKLYVFL